jgi:hypothetical protein
MPEINMPISVPSNGIAGFQNEPVPDEGKDKGCGERFPEASVSDFILHPLPFTLQPLAFAL